MGEVVGAGLIAHVPTMVLPEATRRELNNGRDFSLNAAMDDLRRDVFETLDYDTVIVLDAHWFTTIEFVVTAQDRRSGLFTAEELPRGMCRMPYDWRGDPELAHLIAAKGTENSTWITPIDDHYLPLYYPSIIMWDLLGKGLDKRWISLSIAQTGETEDFLRVGRAIGQAVAQSDRKVLILASGAMSHTFFKLRQLRDHEAADVHHIFSREAYEADMERLAWFKEGNHAAVLDTMGEFLRFRPEAMFAHYLMMAGALGEHDLTATGRQYGEYENSVGTGQVHVWFDRPEGGFPRAHATASDPDFVRQSGGSAPLAG